MAQACLERFREFIRDIGGRIFGKSWRKLPGSSQFAWIRPAFSLPINYSVVEIPRCLEFFYRFLGNVVQQETSTKRTRRVGNF